MNQRRRRNKTSAPDMQRKVMDGSGITLPLRIMSSSCNAPAPLEFQPWIEIVTEVRSVYRSEDSEMLVIVESFE